MSDLSNMESKIYNAGERLIPGRTHDYAEVRRHYGSYYFFKRIIEADMAQRGTGGPVTIVDLGSGVGHGCRTLSTIPGARVLGVDMSEDSLDYARKNYMRENIEYQQSDLIEFVAGMGEYDYVVSRGVLEHVPDGINLALRSRWRARLIFDVPYNEPSGRNPHHVISEITEASFAAFDHAELVYQDLKGVIFNAAQKPPAPNMIMCVCRNPSLGSIGQIGITFPFIADWSQCGAEANPQPEPPAPAPQIVVTPDVNRAGLLRRAARKVKRILTGGRG